ncbi:MAG: acyl carrier protein, partial [Acinetobacter sp.]
MNIAKRVKEIIIEELRVDEDAVLPKASFTDDLGADSLAVVELIMALEGE